MDFDEEAMLFDDPEDHNCETSLSSSAMELDGSDMILGSNAWQNSSPRLLMCRTDGGLVPGGSLEAAMVGSPRLEDVPQAPRTAHELEEMPSAINSSLPTTSAQPSDNAFAKENVVSKIESILESMVDVLIAKKGVLALQLKSRPRNQASKNSTSQLIQYPAKSARDAWKFAVVIRILEHIHESLVSDATISKREIYYRTPSLFVTQAVVDRYVDDIAFTFGVSRFALNVVAAAKGLVAGAFSVCKGNGQHGQSFNDSNDNLVPALTQSDSLDVTAVRWVLIVEKEVAIFQSLVSSKFWHDAKSMGVILTGKGYPDLATRKLVRALSQAMATGPASPRIYGLVDSDPDGIGILSTYKHGSESLAHENAGLITPSIKWLGVKITDVVPLESSNTSSASSVHGDLGLIRLSLRDRRKVTKMLQKPTFEDDTEPEWRRDLQVMLALNVKAEIEILESRQGGLAGWLQQRLGIGNHGI